MSENSKIEWTDHTMNFWTGCEHVSLACAHCYAEAWAKRAGRDFAERRRSTDANWRKPLKWNREAHAAFGRPARVFTNSLADFFDNKVPVEWRADALAVIRDTPNLHWQILTKRIGNVRKMIESAADWHFDRGDRNVAGWLTDWYKHGIAPENVWLGSTIVTQGEADRDIPKLLSIPARVRFLSCEPLLGPIDLNRFMNYRVNQAVTGKITYTPIKNIDWVIAGSESGPRARACDLAWIRSLRDQCVGSQVPFFWKQHVVNGKKFSTPEMDGRKWLEFPH